MPVCWRSAMAVARLLRDAEAAASPPPPTAVEERPSEPVLADIMARENSLDNQHQSSKFVNSMVERVFRIRILYD
jgi:hypothetical protein